MPPKGFTREDALEYHAGGRPGKIAITLTKPCATQRDLTLAYSPGVAEPCREIHKQPLDAYAYTNKGNLVAVLSNGTAILGLGDLGSLASKPVMEGKALLFKRFADTGHPRVPRRSAPHRDHQRRWTAQRAGTG